MIKSMTPFIRHRRATLLCTAAVSGLLAFSSAAQARGIFDQGQSVTTIEINLDAIEQLKASRAQAAMPSAPVEAQKAEAPEVATPQAEPAQEAADAEAPVETAPQAEEHRLPIVIKKVEAPVAPAYQGETLVHPSAAAQTEETEPKEPRTVASMVKNWFWSSDDSEKPANTANATEENEAQADSDEGHAAEAQAATSQDDEDVTQIEQLPEASATQQQPQAVDENQSEENGSTPQFIRPEAHASENQPVVIGGVNNGSPVIYQAKNQGATTAEDEQKQAESQAADVETQENTVVADKEKEEKASGETESLFSRFADMFRGHDTEKKKEAIEITKSQGVAQSSQDGTPSILESRNDKLEVIHNGEELLDNGKEEKLVNPALHPQEPSGANEEEVASLPQAKPENNMIILPNKIDKSDIAAVMGEMPLPVENPRRHYASQEEKPAVAKRAQAETVVPTPKAKQTSESHVPAPKSLEMANVDHHMHKKQQLHKVPEKPVTFVPIESAASPAKNEEDKGPIDMGVPAIPDTAAVVEKAPEAPELKAAPVKVEEEKPSFMQRIGNWWKKKKSNDETNVAKQEEQALPAAEKEADVLPPSLPTPVAVMGDAKPEAPAAPTKEVLPKVFDIKEKAIAAEPSEPTAPEPAPVVLRHLNEPKVEEAKKAVKHEIAKAQEVKKESEKSTALASLEPSSTASTAMKHVKPADFSDKNALLTLNFIPAQTEMRAEEKEKIVALADKIKGDKEKRLKIISYASQVEEQSGSARRVSLQRAIAIRAVLIHSGIDSVRINVQAMGDRVEGGIVDRADIEVIKD